MMDPRIAAGFFVNKPNNISTPAMQLFQEIATGDFVYYPAHYISHPGLIGTIQYWPSWLGDRVFGYPSTPHDTGFSWFPGNFPANDNYPGMS